MRYTKKRIVAILFILAVSIAMIFIFSGNKSVNRDVKAAATDNVAGYAWSENIGWISFNCTDGGTCATSNYGVNLDFGTSNLSGYAWSENIGWVSFNAADVAGCPAGTCQPRYSSGTGELLGWARALANGGGWDGWVSLNCLNSGVCATSNYKVTLSGSDFIGYGWGGDVFGWIKFNPAFGGVYLANIPPAAINLAATPPDYCSSGASAILSWTFSDPDAGSSQTAYQVQIATDAGFATIIKDSCSPAPGTCALGNSSSSYATPAGTLAYSQTYYWRVQVWDDKGATSGWVYPPNPNPPPAPQTISPGTSFSTPIHAYPTANFTYLPATPLVGQEITFTDASTAFGGATITTRNWDFCKGATCSNQTAAGTPVTHTYTVKNNYTVELVVSDSTPVAQGGPFTCPTTKVLNLTKSLLSPGWKEVKPK